MSQSNLYHYSAKVDRVVDGDTIDVTFDLGFSISYCCRVRLLGIDAPESRTRDKEEKVRGLAAKDFVKAWITARKKKVIIQTMLDDKGKFGRVLGMILDADGECLNEKMLCEGHATPYRGGKR
jgi:micrococcal nuclease